MANEKNEPLMNLITYYYGADKNQNSPYVNVVTKSGEVKSISPPAGGANNINITQVSNGYKLTYSGYPDNETKTVTVDTDGNVTPE
jgi:hypothetical protein